MPYTVYILYSASLDRYYKGYTSNLADRLHRHNAGYGRYAKTGKPWELIWHTTKSSRSEAIGLERKLKNMNREKLEAFVEKYS